LEDHGRWDEFIKVYDEAIGNTATKHAPWYIIPDDHRWFAKTAVVSIIADKLKSFHSQYPRMTKNKKNSWKRRGDSSNGRQIMFA
jgi:hypothetical protein